VNRTSIEWCDRTWNPVTGCLHRCEYCYARMVSQRFGKSFDPIFHEDRLDEPIRARAKSLRIFVCSMADLFGSWVLDDSIRQILSVVRRAPWHQFIFLTKNPGRLREFNPWPENAWVGATAVNQEQADRAIAGLADVAGKTFICCEPLLEHVDLFGASFIKWLIIGAQTGPGGHQPHVHYVESLLIWAGENRIPVFQKNNLIWPDRRQEFPDELNPEKFK